MQGTEMKRVEVIIECAALAKFKDAAPKLGVEEFDATEVYCSAGVEVRESTRCRGREIAAALLPRLKIDFVVSDRDVKVTLHNLLECMHPESVAIFRVDGASGVSEDAPPE